MCEYDHSRMSDECHLYYHMLMINDDRGHEHSHMSVYKFHDHTSEYACDHDDDHGHMSDVCACLL